MHNIPLEKLNLEVPQMQVLTADKTKVSRPITDHPPIIQNTVYGAIGTINILNPGSPIAEPMREGVVSFPKRGKKQMELMAQYIFNMFEKGVVLLALQEVPSPGSNNFKFLRNKLQELVGTSGLIDVDALTKQWLQTGTHKFGTSLLYNPNIFTMHQNATHVLDNRAGLYGLTHTTGAVITVANLHGDFKKPKDTLAYIESFGTGLCLGDTNLSELKQSEKTSVVQSIVKPGLMINGEQRNLNTIDIIRDSSSRLNQTNYQPSCDEISKDVLDKQAHSSMVSFPPVEIELPITNRTSVLDRFKKYLSDNNITQLTNIHTDAIRGLKSKDDASIVINNQNTYQKYLDYFYYEKKQMEEEFNRSLEELLELSNDSTEALKVYEALLEAGDNFFTELMPDKSQTQIEFNMFYFKSICSLEATNADRLLGHGWTFRLFEVVAKAVGALFVGALMTVGSLACQGFAKSEHRQWYSDTFFSLHRTKGTKAVAEFREKVLGDEQGKEGLLDKCWMAP